MSNPHVSAMFRVMAVLLLIRLNLLGKSNLMVANQLHVPVSSVNELVSGTSRNMGLESEVERVLLCPIFSDPVKAAKQIFMECQAQGRAHTIVGPVSALVRVRLAIKGSTKCIMARDLGYEKGFMDGVLKMQIRNRTTEIAIEECLDCSVFSNRAGAEKKVLAEIDCLRPQGIAQ